MTAPLPVPADGGAATGGLGEAIFEDSRVSEVRRELKAGWAVGNIRAAALLAAYDELSASAFSAAREIGRAEGAAKERERIAQIEALVTAAMETAIGWSGEPEGAPTVDAMDLHNILYPAPPPL